MIEEELKFPVGFKWGTATSSYQIEGAVNEGGRSSSIWDRFCRQKGRIHNEENGDVSIDHYHCWQEDVDIMADLGIPYYRFSIAWPRILPDGMKGKVNKEGVEFYRKLIKRLKAKNIQPVPTLYHWDLPVCIEDETGGWSGDGRIIDEFVAYARVCYESFGDLCQWWITINEPWCCAFLGYETGEQAPGNTDKPGVHVYRVGHNILLAHAKSVKAYREEFQPRQKGWIGITLNSDWAEPIDESSEEAAQRDLAFTLGWFADPIYFGDYPKEMREACGDRLPKFTEEERKEVMGSSDFFGLNHYTTHLVADSEPEQYDAQETSYFKDRNVKILRDPKWKLTDMGIGIVPWGLRKLLVYVQNRYNPKGGVYVVENGLASLEPTVEAALNDKLREEYMMSYLREVKNAMDEGVPVKGYFWWTLIDNFEWAYGYSKRYGMVYVDMETKERTVKPVAKLFSRIIRDNALPSVHTRKVPSKVNVSAVDAAGFPIPDPVLTEPLRN